MANQPCRVVVKLRRIDLTALDDPVVHALYRFMMYGQPEYTPMLGFISKEHFEGFKQALPELIPYIEAHYPDSCFEEPPPVKSHIQLPDDGDSFSFELIGY